MRVRIERWGPDDLPLLHKLHGDPVMMEHLGGAWSAEQIEERHERYLRLEPPDAMFTIVDEDGGQSLGSVGYWEREWRGEQVYETGWFVLPEFQGRGIAVAGTRQAIDLAAAERRHRFMHAFPNVQNTASNAICRKLGFTLLEDLEFEYPKGSFMRCNDWRLELFATRPSAATAE
jgi:RimJ/RimL family protein N-acetyltransferase